MSGAKSPTSQIWHLIPPILSLLLFLSLGAYQLQLPGLHYDEAKEAGLNAMQLLTGQPLTPFRNASVQIGAWQLPLMVQDYIGALNVFLALPFLKVGGINTVALRSLPLLTGGITLLLVWQVARHLAGPAAAHATAALLAANPSFVFWCRQGIFVTNLTTLFFFASLLTGIRWWARRRPLDLWLTAFFWGLGLYAKLLFVWAIGAMLVTAAIAWLIQKAKPGRPAVPNQKVSRQIAAWLGAAVCFLVPLIPLILFNLRTGGTFTSIFGNLESSYYGVNNSAYLPNLVARLEQLRTLLRGDHLWYLGGTFVNPWALWLAGGLILLAVLVALQHSERGIARWTVFLPLILLALIVAQSTFTVSDLFITHYMLLLPLFPLAGGVSTGSVLLGGKRLVKGLLIPAILLWAAWFGTDLRTTVQYHQALARSGGHSSHSSAIADLSAYLNSQRPQTSVALDWGIDAQVRFLTAGQVTPFELFGYENLATPDEGFAERIAPFLAQSNTLYLAHTPTDTVFGGRVEALAALAAEQGLTLCEQARFAEQSGRPLYIVYRATLPENCF